MEDKNIDVICCETFKQNFKIYGWYKIQHLNTNLFLMPHIKSTNIRLNYCPSCGKDCRETTLSEELYNS